MKINWKKITFIFCGFLLSATICLACFDDDPDSGLWDAPEVIEGEDGSTIDVNIGGGNITHFEGTGPWEDVEGTENSYATTIEASFPLSLQLSFSGFLNYWGSHVSEPITRMCILYFSKDKRWIIYKEIRNPKFKVIYEDDELRALFGKYAISHPLGYSEGEPLPILIYFESEHYKSFTLDSVLDSKNPKPIDKQVIAIIVKNNTTPR